jgi:hypothetical protein
MAGEELNVKIRVREKAERKAIELTIRWSGAKSFLDKSCTSWVKGALICEFSHRVQRLWDSFILCTNKVEDELLDLFRAGYKCCVWHKLW